METGVADQYLKLNGLRFHYRDWGNADAQALVCLHGFTGHARVWDCFARAMRDEYHVLALDQRGHGETDWATDYHAQRRVQDLEAFVAALGLNGFVLLGHSMGGRLAYQYTYQHPDQVGRLVDVDSVPQPDERAVHRINDGLRRKDVFADPEEAVQAARRANPRPPDAELRARVLYGLKQLEDGTWSFRYDVALRNDSGARVMPTPEEVEHDWSSLSKITCPTLLVRGAESDAVTPELAERFARSIPNCRVVDVPNSGHSVPMDNPGGFLAAVKTFL